MKVSAISMSSQKLAFKGNPATNPELFKAKDTVLMNKLRVGAIGVGISASVIAGCETVDKLKELIKEKVLTLRGDKLSIYKEKSESLDEFKERIDFKTYKTKANKVGADSEILNCKTSAEIKEKLNSEEVQKNVFEKKLTQKEEPVNQKNTAPEYEPSYTFDYFDFLFL